MKSFSQFSAGRLITFDRNLRPTLVATAAALVVGLGVTAAGVNWLHDDLQARARSRFEQQVQHTETDVQSRMAVPFFGLKAAAGVYAASQSVERAEFRAYVESSQVALEFRGIRGFGFVEHVKRHDLHEFIAAQKKDGSPDFSVRTQGDSPEMYVIKFIEPLPANQAAVGMDIGIDDVQLQAVERAINTGEQTLSGRIHLVQDDQQRPAFVFMVPVYGNGTRPTTPAERRAALTGVLVAPVVVEEFMADLAASAQSQVDIELYDGPDANFDNLLFDLDGSQSAANRAADSAADARRMFHASRLLHVGGRALTLRMGTTPSFEAQVVTTSVSALVGLAGVLLSALLAFSVWLLGSGRARAQALAQRMTLDLATERKRLANIVEGTNVGTWVWHVQTGEVQLDERWAAMIGCDVEELGTSGAATWRGRTHPDDVIRAKQALRRHFSGETEHFECESRIRHKDGQWVWVLDRGKVSAWTADGKPEVMSGTHMDISDKQAAKTALQASEEHFRHLFERSLDGILQALPDGSVLYANPAACRLFGMSQDEIRQRGRAGLADSEDSRFHILMEQALMNGEARGELTMVRGDGSHFECEMSSSHYVSQNGESCTNIFLRDVTKRKLAEAQVRALNTELEDRVRRRTAQLEAANKELEAFSYSVAHDLRSPLNSIDGFSHLLQKEVSADSADRAKHYLSRIRAGVRQMGELTDGLLALAHLSRTSLKTVPVDLSAMARRVLENFQERDPERGVKVTVESDLQALGDAALLRQVMENLLENSWKFTANFAEPEVQVGKLPGEDGTEVYFVRDNGAGFDMAYADKLFGTFQRLHSPGEYAGTGIGLATSHRIISRHGGRIWAEGAVGKGATFFFSLPAAPGAVRVGQAKRVATL